MTLQWLSVSAFLYTEIGLGLLLCIGFISNARWRSVFSSRILTAVAHHGTYFVTPFVLMLFVLFADSAWNTYRFSQIDTSHVDLRNNPQAEVQVHMKLFRAERNVYITGFSLFLLIVLRRLVTLISRQAQLEAMHEAAIKQATGASEQATKLMQENEDLQKGTRTQAVESTREAEEEKKDLLDMVDTLKEDLNETTAKLETAEADLSAMKLQVEGTNREYDRMLEEHSKLQKRVSILADAPAVSILADAPPANDKKED